MVDIYPQRQAENGSLYGLARVRSAAAMKFTKAVVSVALAAWVPLGFVGAQQRPSTDETQAVTCRTIPNFGLYGSVRLLAHSQPSDDLCPLVDAWLGWHSTGLARLVRGFPLSPDSLFTRIDLSFALHRGKMATTVNIFADSVTAGSPQTSDSLLFLRMIDEERNIAGERQSLSWAVRFTSRAPDPAKLWFSTPVPPLVTVASPAPGVRVRVVASVADSLKSAVLDSQWTWLTATRAAFGQTTPLPPLDVLVGPPGDTTLAFLGVQATTVPYYATTWLRPPLLISPMTQDGGVDPHELAHLVHLTSSPRAFNALAIEGFAIAIGGSFGRSLDTEVCELFRREPASRALLQLDRKGLRSAVGGPWMESLLFATAVRHALGSLTDSSRYFGAERWQPSRDAWDDLAELLGVPTGSLYQSTQRLMQGTLTSCPVPVEREPFPS